MRHTVQRPRRRRERIKRAAGELERERAATGLRPASRPVWIRGNGAAELECSDERDCPEHRGHDCGHKDDGTHILTFA
jgi:hypothetical protein